MTNKHIKRYSISLVTREIQMKATIITYNYTTIKMVILKKSDNNIVRNWKTWNFHRMLVQKQICTETFENGSAIFYKVKHTFTE